jgi:hypothetical protein
MGTRWLALAALLALASTSRAAEPIGLSVLYAGNPGNDRENDFKAFLSQHFARVGTADYRKFKDEGAKGYDVVILDWTSIYPRDKDGKILAKIDRLNSPDPIPSLSEGYDRPTILIGAAGGSVGIALRLKIDWR